MDRKPGLTGSQLKWIALTAMLADHIGAVLCFSTHTQILLRCVGRLTFPLYCFLLTQGFYHTRNIRRYLGRLGALAIISQLPYMLAFGPEYAQGARTNVFFTLFLGLVMLQMLSQSDGYRSALSVLGICILAQWVLQCDYGITGILIILLFDLFCDRPAAGSLGASLLLTVTYGPIGLCSLPCFFLIRRYNGKEGRNYKLFFYLFYPVHLLILAGLRLLLA